MSRPHHLAAGPAVLVGLLLPTLAAQQFGFDPVRAQLPELLIDGRAVRFADLDGDGDADVLLADDSGPTRLLWNLGHGRFALAAPDVIPAGAPARHLALADIDGDGDLDLAESGPGNERLLRNDGGVFHDVSAAQWSASPYHPELIAFADLDGDADPDALVGAWDYVRLLENRGGVFVDVSAGRLPPTLGLALAIGFGDVDGDGDLDVFARADRTRLCLNDGHGSFVDVSATQVPDHPGAAAHYLCEDFDRDGDVDVYVPVRGGELSPKQDQLLLNDGAGRFRDATATHLPVEWYSCGGAAAADVDGDSDLDVVCANVFVMGPEPIAAQLFLNDGSAHFTLAGDSGFPTEAHALFDVALGDLDGDGDPDLVFACWEPCPLAPGGFTRLFLNDAAGHFVDATQRRLPRSEFGRGTIAAAEFDGDGIPDLLLADGQGKAELLLGDGLGAYHSATDAVIEWRGMGTEPVALLFDADGDGDTDAYLGGERQDALLLNDGARSLRDASANLPGESGTALAAALGDFDRDGAPDLAIGSEQGLWLWLNRAGGITGRFAASAGVPVIGEAVRAVLALDVDADGDLDLILGCDLRDRLLRNDGRGTFDEDASALPNSAPRYTRCLAAGDLDDDGDPDLVFGHTGDDRVYINDGDGRFRDESAARMPPELFEARALALADFDEDGDPDLLVSQGGEYWGEPLLLRLNDGRGVFRDATPERLPASRARGHDALPLDIDGDGDLDAVLYDHLCCQPIFCTQGQARILVNRHRQLAAPAMPSRGGVLELQFFAQPGYAQGLPIALPALSRTPAHAPIPLLGLGSFALDAGSTIALPWLAVNAAPSRLLIPVPTDPALSSAALSCQALFVDPLGIAAPRLSNAIATRILD
jgi:hypothetical protein